jgi:cytochrome c oxidase cbb3-type subunit 3
MKILFACTTLALLPCSLPAQTSEVEHGRAIYRSNCAFCHGLTGTGGRGPDLVSGERKSDAEIKRIVRNGIPGSTMPAFSGFEEDELTRLIAFLHHLAGSATATQKPTGDPRMGRIVYEKSGCAGCHQIGTEGSTYGPELTRIGSARPVRYLAESISDPSKDIPQQFEGVTVVMRDGTKITGLRVNEDSFTVQVRLPSQLIRSFEKEKVKEVRHETVSLMPAYKQMSKSDLETVVAYLSTLKGASRDGAKVKEAEGIR